MERTSERRAEHRGRVRIGQAFNPRANAMNFLRLVFATLVLCDHVHIGGGYCTMRACATSNEFGSMAVDGFFAVSGFLIAGSAQRYALPRFVWRRALRIFPGYWICLLVIIVLGAATASGRYWNAPAGPLPFVFHNFLLQWQMPQIAGTPSGVPFFSTWDASLWTLQWEFECYLLVGVLGAVGALQQRLAILIGALLLWSSAISLEFVSGQNWPPVRCAAVFLAGVVLYLYRDAIPDSPWLALLGASVAVGGFFARVDALLGLGLAYVAVWLAAHLPIRLGSRNDLSYGVYIYGWPVMQILLRAGARSIGYWLLLPAVFVMTLPVAATSWLLIEQPALGLKDLKLADLFRARVGAARRAGRDRSRG